MENPIPIYVGEPDNNQAQSSQPARQPEPREYKPNEDPFPVYRLD